VTPFDLAPVNLGFKFFSGTPEIPIDINGNVYYNFAIGNVKAIGDIRTCSTLW